jgi:FkbM family methyltransferase
MDARDFNHEMLRALVPDARVVYEAGAHKGADTVAMSKLWPDAHVHAFEPVPELFRQLCSNVAFYQTFNVTCWPTAWAQFTGRVPIKISGGTSDGSSSVLMPAVHLEVYPDVTFERELVVPCTTLDAHAVAHECPDVIWADLQGLEYHVFEASPTVMRAVKLAFVEINVTETYRGCGTYQRLKELMSGFGLREEWSQVYTQEGGDALFYRP